MTKQPQEMNWQEALVQHNINFDMETMPLGYIDDYGHHQNVKNVHGMRRADTREVLDGVSVSDRYRVIQTSSYADIGDSITRQTNATFTKGGTLKGGRLAFLQAKLPDCIRVKGTNDVIEKELTFINSFDGSTPFMILPLGFRIVCENQMAAINRSMRQNNGLRIRHTASSEERLKQADEAVLEALNAFRAFEVKINFLADQKFTDAMMDIASRRLFSVEKNTPVENIPTRTINNINQVRELFETGQGNTQWRGTAFGAYNAITEYSDHHRSLRATTDTFEAKTIGSGANMKDKGLVVIEDIIAETA